VQYPPPQPSAADQFHDLIQTVDRDVYVFTGQQWELIMFYSIQRIFVYCWDFVFTHEVSPLRHIPDVAIRHYVLQALGLMWALAFAVAAGSYTFLAVSVIGHTVLIAAAAITVTTWTAATAKPDLFVRGSIRKETESPKSPLNN
jgi:hypothetical protein